MTWQLETHLLCNLSYSEIYFRIYRFSFPWQQRSVWINFRQHWYTIEFTDLIDPVAKHRILAYLLWNLHWMPSLLGWVIFGGCTSGTVPSWYSLSCVWKCSICFSIAVRVNLTGTRLLVLLSPSLLESYWLRHTLFPLPIPSSCSAKTQLCESILDVPVWTAVQRVLFVVEKAAHWCAVRTAV